MNEPLRLLRHGSPCQRAMLAAAKDDAPKSSSQERVLLALGLAGAVVAIGSTAEAATSSTVTSSASLSAPTSSGIGHASASAGLPSLAAPAVTSLAPTASLTVVLVMKWVAAATLLLSMGVAGGLVARNFVWSAPGIAGASRGSDIATAISPPNLAPNQASARPASTRGSARAEATLPLPPPVKDLEPSETPERVSPNSTSPRLGAESRVEAGLTVRGEIVLVEKARAALRQGDPKGCLSFLEIRRKGVRGGVLTPEATILRIEALRSLGQRERATEEAVRFFHDYPDSPLLERIRDLLAASEP